MLKNYFLINSLLCIGNIFAFTVLISCNSTETPMKGDSLSAPKTVEKAKKGGNKLLEFSTLLLKEPENINLDINGEYSETSFNQIQLNDTLIVKFNHSDGLADWKGQIEFKCDSVILYYGFANPNEVAKELNYYTFIYKILNPERKKYKFTARFLNNY